MTTQRRSTRAPIRIKDVASHAGVSSTTVSNVLNETNRISPETQRRVLASIRELGYVRNGVARQLRAGTSTTIGMVVPDGSNPFYSAIARGVEDAALELGGSVLVGNSGHDAGREARYLSLFEEQRLRGVLIAPVADPTETIRALQHRGVAAVLVGRLAHPETCSSVSIDNIAGGYVAVRHLLLGGRRRIAFVGSPSAPGVRERLQGARSALAETPDASLEIIDEPGFDVDAGRRTAEALLRRPARELPDGLFCANDLLATGVLHRLFNSRRVRIPEDVAIIGYDDIDFASSTIVPLSSVRQPTNLIGRTAVELLNDELEDPDRPHRHVLFPPVLVERESTR
jgi:LacI family transcriptional regulator